MSLWAIAGGGALGALLRYGVSNGLHAWLGRGFPYGTLTVNLVGSFFMGLLFVLFNERLALAPEWRGFFLVGLLGAFTTFSTFSIETLVLIQQADYGKALLNVFGNLLLCLLAVWGGLILGRQL
jgi:CrcB protein